MQFQKPVLKQEMRLKMSPQLLQSISLLALPLQNLKLKIKEEVDKNPALEFVNESQAISFDEIVDKKGKTSIPLKTPPMQVIPQENGRVTITRKGSLWREP